MVRADNGAVSRVAQRMAGIGGKRPAQVVVPITGPVAAVGNRQNISDNGDNYNQIHIEEVIDCKNKDHRELSVITGRWLQTVNRQ